MAATTAFRHKHVRIDQLKLDRARRILEAETETETLDRALALVVSRSPHRRLLFAACAAREAEAGLRLTCAGW